MRGLLLAVAAACAACQTNYDYDAQLAPPLFAAWKTIGSHITITLTYRSDNVTWFAFGVGFQPGMVGTDAIVFEPGRPAGQQINQYTLSAKSDAGVSMVPASQATITSASWTTAEDGAAVVTVTRPLAEGSYPGSRSIPSDGPVWIAWAHGGQSGSPSVLGQHTEANRGSGWLNFATGLYKPTTESVYTLRLTHGALMFIAWGVLVPLGIFAARFTKARMPHTGSNPFWFTAHRVLQGCAFALFTIALVLAIVMVFPGYHFRQAHSIIGLITMLLGLLQPILAFVRPAAAPPGYVEAPMRRAWQSAHRGMGYLSALLAVPAIFLGLRIYGAHVGFLAAYAVFAALLLGAFAVLERRRQREVAAAQAKALDDAHRFGTDTGGSASGEVDDHPIDPAAVVVA